MGVRDVEHSLANEHTNESEKNGVPKRRPFPLCLVFCPSYVCASRLFVCVCVYCGACVSPSSSPFSFRCLRLHTRSMPLGDAACERTKTGTGEGERSGAATTMEVR